VFDGVCVLVFGLHLRAHPTSQRPSSISRLPWIALLLPVLPSFSALASRVTFKT